MDKNTHPADTATEPGDFGDCELFRTRFINGDKLALIECLLYSATRNYPFFEGFPDWAQRQLVVAAWNYLSGVSDDFHDAIFGAKKAKGRHSNPSRARLDRLKHQLWFDVVWAQEQQGFKGDEKYVRAIELLQTGATIRPDGSLTFGGKDDTAVRRRDKVPALDTLRKKYLKMKKAGNRPLFAFAFIPVGSFSTELDEAPLSY